MIRSTKHYLNSCNSGKKETIASFLKEYRIAVQSYIDYIWCNVILDHKQNIIWDLNKNKLNLPMFLDYKVLNNKKLSVRSLSAASSQAISVVKSSIAIKRKILYIISKRKE